MGELKVKWIHIFNLMLAIAIAVVFVVLLVTVRHFGSSDYAPAESTLQEINDGWVQLNNDGSISEFTKFGVKIDTNEITLSRIFIFDMEEKRDAIKFKSYYSAVEVYQDGSLIYSYGNPEDVSRGTLLGLYNCVVPLQVYYGEATEIEVHLLSNMDMKVNSFYYGSSEDCVASRYSNSLFTTVFSVSMLVVALVMLAFAFIGRKRLKFANEYFYFLTFLVFAAIWAITDIQILSALGVNSGVVCILSYECFTFMALPFMVYMYYICKRLRVLDIIAAILLFLNFIAVNTLHFSKTLNFVQSVISTQILIGISLVFVVVQVVYEIIKERNFKAIAMLISIILVCIGAAIQLNDFYSINKYSSSEFLQAGISLFVIFQLALLFSGVFRLVDEGRKAEDYLSMAKTDPLTGLGNRRGLDLFIAEIAKRSAPFYRLGCIVCDLNDLKRTNDIYGHDVGDRLIKDFANCLQVCFENRGKVFRTGGDEFYILFSDVEVDMSAMMRRLTICLDGSNSTAEYKISCSRGCYADYVAANNEDAIWDIIKFADAEMYKMKKADRAKRRAEDNTDNR